MTAYELKEKRFYFALIFVDKTFLYHPLHHHHQCIERIKENNEISLNRKTKEKTYAQQQQTCTDQFILSKRLRICFPIFICIYIYINLRKKRKNSQKKNERKKKS